MNEESDEKPESSDDAIQKYLSIKKEEDLEKPKKKKLPRSTHGALNPDKMQYREDEKEIQQYYRDGIIAELKEKKGTDQLSRSEELITDIIGFATVRLYRKAKLESMYGRFLDRSAPQDPGAQIIVGLKALNLATSSSANATNRKDEKSNIKVMLGKMLSEESQTTVEGTGGTPTFEEWKKQELANGSVKIERRSTQEFAIFEDDFSDNVFEEEPD